VKTYFLKLSNSEDSFSRSIWVSLIAHSAILSFLLLKTVFFPQEAIDYSAAVKVDIVGLPDKITQTPEKMEPQLNAPEPLHKTQKDLEKNSEAAINKLPEVKTNPDAISLEKNKSKQKEALRKLKALSAIDKIKSDLDSEERNKKVSALEQKQIKGNIISPGTALSGLNRLQHDNYISQLDQHVKQHWFLPQWLAELDLKAQVRVKINSQGQLVSKQIIK